MVLIIFTQYHILNIHVSIAATRTMASYGSTAAEESAVTVAVVLKQQPSVTTTHKNTKSQRFRRQAMTANKCNVWSPTVSKAAALDFSALVAQQLCPCALLVEQEKLTS